jgi:hypothetical protein
MVLQNLLNWKWQFAQFHRRVASRFPGVISPLFSMVLNNSFAFCSEKKRFRFTSIIIFICLLCVESFGALTANGNFPMVGASYEKNGGTILYIFKYSSKIAHSLKIYPITNYR